MPPPSQEIHVSALYLGMVLKLKGTRDGGFRRLYKIDGDQLWLIQLRKVFRSRPDKEWALEEVCGMTCNHIDKVTHSVTSEGGVIEFTAINIVR